MSVNTMMKTLGLHIAGVAGMTLFLGAATLPTVQFGNIHFSGNVVLAQSDGTSSVKLQNCKAPPEKRRLKSLDQKFFKRVGEVDVLTNPPENEKTGKAAEPNFKAAWPKLKKLLDRCDDCNEYEWAQLYQRAAFIQYSLDNVPSAIDYFQRVVAKSPNIPVSLEAQLLYQIAQLLTSEEKYRESLEYFDKWEALCPEVVPSDYFYFRGQNLYLLNRKDEALAEVAKSIRVAEERGDVPREGWYKLQMAILIDKEDYKGAEKVAETLAVRYTNHRIITQLASLYGMNGREQAQMALLDALNVVDALEKESEYKNLAYLYLGAEAPYLSSKVLSKGIDNETVERTAKNLEIWAVSLSQAQEIDKATPIMEEAAKKADDGKLYAILAAIYLDGEQYEKAVTTAKRALTKGDLRSDGEVHMYLGSAYLNMERYEEALGALRKATKDEKYEKYAGDLMGYVKKEMKRKEDLKNSAQADAEAEAVDIDAGADISS